MAGRKKIGDNGGRILARVTSTVSDSPRFQKGVQSAGDVTGITKKLLKSTRKAAWIVGTTFLLLALPLITELEHDCQLDALELQQASLLGTPPPAAH